MCEGFPEGCNRERSVDLIQRVAPTIGLRVAGLP